MGREETERVPLTVGSDATLPLAAADADSPVVTAEPVPLNEDVGKVSVWLPVTVAETLPFKVADGVM